MSRKRRPRKGLRPAGTRWSSMFISLEDITVVVKKIQEKLPHFNSNDRDSEKDSFAELHASKN